MRSHIDNIDNNIISIGNILLPLVIQQYSLYYIYLFMYYSANNLILLCYI